jgi:hypothetical protein
MDLRAQLEVTNKREDKLFRVARFGGGGGGCLPLRAGWRSLRMRLVAAGGGEEVAASPARGTVVVGEVNFG